MIVVWIDRDGQRHVHEPSGSSRSEGTYLKDGRIVKVTQVKDGLARFYFAEQDGGGNVDVDELLEWTRLRPISE